MKNYNIFKIIALLCSLNVIISCGGYRTFNEYARAGDTVAVPVGMQTDFSKDNITVTITPSSGPLIILPATDPSIRAVVNFYPDPLSSLVVSREIGEDLTPIAQNYSNNVNIFANDDKDWFQTTVFVDLPPTLPVGLTQVEISNGLGATHTETLDIISGVGSPHVLQAALGNNPGAGQTPLNANMLDGLARTPHQTVSFSSATIPYAIELNFSHDPDITVGGTGKATVINPLGYKKSLQWKDDGINLKVILIQSKDGIADHIKDFKFYIAGTATNLVLNSHQAYDSNGVAIAGVSASMVASN